MKTTDAAAEARARRALSTTSGNRDAMEAATAMLAAFNPHGGYEDASFLVGVAAQATEPGRTDAATSSPPVDHGPEAQVASPVAHQVRGVDPKTVEAAQIAAAQAEHDAAVGAATSPEDAAQARSPVPDETGLTAHAGVDSGGGGFHEDAFAHLELAAPADPTQSGRLYGDTGDNTLRSGEGAVGLFGGRGDDILVSNGDGDRLVGGKGADTFVFSGFETAKVGVIENLGRGDVVDLSPAAAQFGLDHFTAVHIFDGQAGEVTATFDAAHDRTVFKFDVNGDGHADYRLIVDHGDYTDFGHFLDVDHHGLQV